MTCIKLKKKTLSEISHSNELDRTEFGYINLTTGTHLVFTKPSRKKPIDLIQIFNLYPDALLI